MRHEQYNLPSTNNLSNQIRKEIIRMSKKKKPSGGSKFEFQDKVNNVGTTHFGDDYGDGDTYTKID